MKNAARIAKQLFSTWQAKNKPKVEQQMNLFDLPAEED
jgi:hypothetical protein